MELHFHNVHHLGDSVFNFIFFYNIKQYIENNNISIFYYANNEYLIQLKEFICSQNISLKSLDYKPHDSIHLWIGERYSVSYFNETMPINFNLFLQNFFNNITQNIINIPIQINNFCYDDIDLINRYENIDNKYKNYDILVLNSTPLSGQFFYHKTEWDNYIIQLNNSYKILTTTKVNDNILCTMDDNLTIKDIASLSIKAKVIIAVNSGVVPGLLNIYTLKNVKHFYIFDLNVYYSYPNFENKNNINDISVDELKQFI